MSDIPSLPFQTTVDPKRARISGADRNNHPDCSRNSVLHRSAVFRHPAPDRHHRHAAFAGGLVEATGIEPVTPCLQSRCSPAELRPHSVSGRGPSLVGPGRLELPTSRLSSARSNQLSYKPLTTGGGACRSARPPMSMISKADDLDVDQAIASAASPVARVRPRRKRNEDGGVPPNGF